MTICACIDSIPSVRTTGARHDADLRSPLRQPCAHSLCSGSVGRGNTHPQCRVRTSRIRSMAAEFAKETGHKIALKVVTPSDIPKNLASDPYDMIICSVPAMAVFDKA